MSEHRCREALRLAVQLSAGDSVANPRTVERVADSFSEWLACCPPDPIPDGTVSGALQFIINQLEKVMSQQSDVDAATAALTAMTTDVAANVSQLVNTDIPAIQAALAALPASVDTTALDAAVAAAAGTTSSLDTAVSSVTSLTSPPAAPPAS